MRDPQRAARSSAWLLGLVVLLAVGPWVKHLTVQPAARLALTAAIVDEGTIRIDRYEPIVGIDRVDRDGHVYSDKAPGQPLLAAPFYAAARAVGAEPAEVVRGTENLTLWWVTLWSSAVPGALIAVLVVGLCVAHGARPRTAVASAAMVSFGTLLLPFSAELYGHVLATLFGLAAVTVVDRRSGVRWMAAAGALVGLAVTVEYQMVVFGVAVLVLAVRRHGWRTLVPMAAAGAPFAAGLLVYQAAAFGSPLRTSYGEKPVHDSGGATIVGVPDPWQLVEVLFGSRGLLTFTPIVLVALIGLVRLVRGRDHRSSMAAVALAIFAGYLLLQAGWPNPWGGEMPGPRYVIPALPLLALGLTVAWPRSGLAGRAALAWSTVAMVLPLVTLHLVPDGGFAVRQHIANIDDYGVSATVWTMALGPAGWLVHAGSVAAAGWWLRRELADPAPADQTVA